MNAAQAQTAPVDAAAHVLEGEAEITIAGTPLGVPAGSRASIQSACMCLTRSSRSRGLPVAWSVIG